MCCLVTILLVLGPRILLVLWWLTDAARFNLAFSTKVWPVQFPRPYWVWPLIGGIFVPWTTLAYLIVFPGGVVGLDWAWLGLGLLIDLGSHLGGGDRGRTGTTKCAAGSTCRHAGRVVDATGLRR